MGRYTERGPSRRVRLICGHAKGNQREGAADSQTDLAERIEVSRQTVNAVETERYEPSLSLAFKIARLFGEEIEDIFDDGTRSRKK